MKGLPKHCNTKQDYLYLKDNYSEEIWKPLFQQLYDDRLQYFNKGVINSKEEGITDETHKIVESKNEMNIDNNNNETIYYQYELTVNPTAFMFRIGFTEEELESILK